MTLFSKSVTLKSRRVRERPSSEEVGFTMKFLGVCMDETLSLGFEIPATLHFYETNNEKKEKKKHIVRSGIRTHASIRRPERPLQLCSGKVLNLESGALDRSAILTTGYDNHNI